MRRFLTTATLLSALALAPAANAGGPYVNTTNAPRAGLSAGETWVAKLRAANCFGSPAQTGMRPWLAIRNEATGKRIVFDARPVARPSRYETDYVARVIFPTAGNWSYVVGDRLYEFNRYRVTIAGAERARVPAALQAAGGVLLLVALGFGLRRRR